MEICQYKNFMKIYSVAVLPESNYGIPNHAFEIFVTILCREWLRISVDFFDSILFTLDKLVMYLDHSHLQIVTSP